MKLPYGLLDFARYIHAIEQNKEPGFYQMQYIMWLAKYHPLEHDIYLAKCENKPLRRKQ